MRELEGAATRLVAGECEEQQIQQERAFVLRQMGHFAREMMEYGRARELYEQSLALCRATGDEWRMADVLSELGWLASETGEWAKAERYAAQSLTLRRLIGDRVGASVSLRGTSHHMLLQGKLDQAVEHARASVDLCREVGDPRGLSYALGYLGYAQTAQGRFSEAGQTLEESVAIARDRVVVLPRVFLELYLAATKLHLGTYQEVREIYEGVRASTLKGLWGARQFVAHGVAMLAIRDGEYAEAGALLRRMVREARVGARTEWLGLGLGALLYTLLPLETPEARRDVAEALHVCLETGFPLPRLLALGAIALIMLETGEPERAVELYALALSYRFVSGSRWFDEVVGRRIGAAADALPTERVAAAQARGRVRDLELTLRELLAEFADT
jgi:tetratricopeptide (TPR) repeat protein